MDRFTRLFAALEQIFGKGFVSRLMGKQSNVITLPSKDAQRFLNKELNIAEASEAAVKKGIEDLEKLVSDTKKISLINDQELLTLTNNAERVAARSPKIPLPPVAKKPADVVDITTKEKISPEGIMQLKEQAGQVSPPGTMMGNIESKINKLKASVKEMDTGANMDTIMADALKSQQGFKKLQDQGLVTAATRELLQRDIKAGKIKLPKEIEDRIMLVEGDPGRVDPIQIFREQYGEDALEQVDSLVPDLAKAGSYKDLLNVVDKKYTIKPRSSTIPQTMSAEDAAKAEKDLGIKTLKDDIEDPEGFAVGGRVGMAKGGITALKTLINFLAKNRKNYFLEKNLGKVQGPTTGSKSLQALNPKSLGYKQNFLTKEMDQQYLDNRIDYFKNLQNVIKNDRELLINMKALPKEHQDKFYKMINEGGNKGRLDIYNKIDIDDAIMDIEQIIKNAEFKNLSEEAVKRKLNSEGGSQGLDYLMGIERRGYAVGGTGRSPDAAETYSEYKARMLEALRKKHEGQKTASTDLQPDGSYSGVSREIPIEDYFNYMLADAYALGFNPNTGLKFGVDDRGVLTDQYKFKQEMADFKKNSQTTPTMGEPGGIITEGGLKYRINADGSRTLLDTATEQTTPTEDFSDYLDTPTEEQIVSPNDVINDYAEYDEIDATNAGVPDSNLFQKGLTALTPAAQLAKGILGIGGTPITQSMETSLQDIIQNQIKETGNLSGNIDYNDYGVQTSSGAEYLGLGDKSSTDPQAALARTLGRASYAVDPQTGKVNFTGGTNYDFGEDQLPLGLGTFINEGGIRGFLGLDAKEATQYAPNISVNPNYIKQTYQDIAQRQLPYMQQYQQDYQNRRSQVDPNALNTQYLQKLQNPNATNIDQFKSQLQSNLTPTPMNTGGRVC
jgi:hypothetical protein